MLVGKVHCEVVAKHTMEESWFHPYCSFVCSALAGGAVILAANALNARATLGLGWYIAVVSFSIGATGESQVACNDEQPAMHDGFLHDTLDTSLVNSTLAGEELPTN